MNRGDFQALSQVRLVEAKALLDAGMYDGAYYLAGYAVECALKACIARLTQQDDFPPNRRALEDIYSHDFVRLVKAADLVNRLDTEFQSDPSFSSHWDRVTTWTEESRYTTNSQAAAETLYNAITDPEHGVIRWLRQHW